MAQCSPQISARTPCAWKGIASDVLSAAGLYRDASGLVHIPYRGLGGATVRERIEAPSGRRWWSDGEGISLFGLERMPAYSRQSALFVGEGESDTLAAVESDMQAVGCPGAYAFRPEWRPLVEDFALLYAVGDGDPAGVAFTWAVRRAIPWARPVVMPDGFDLRALLQLRQQTVVWRQLAAADQMARLEHAVLNAADLATARAWLR